MKIHHSIHVDRAIAEQMFYECGVHLKQEDDGRFGTYDLAEDDPRWPCVSDALARYAATSDALRGFPIPGATPGDRVWTEFSDEERERASVLELMPAWVHGFPQPQDVHAYMNQTYDLYSACRQCFAGSKQKAPFRMKKRPAWGRRWILHMNWVDDEVFVKPEVYDAIFRPLGIGFVPVVLHKTGAELDNVVQLSIDTFVDVFVDGIPVEHICSCCGRQSYERVCRGFPPSPVNVCAPIFKSTPYFHGSAKRIYVSGDLYRTILCASLKGAYFEPCSDSRK